MSEPNWTTELPAVLYEQPVLTLDPGTHSAMIRRADTDSTGTYVVTGSNDKTVRIWSAKENGKLERTIRLPSGPGHMGEVYAVAISPDGELVAVGGWFGPAATDAYVYVFERESGSLVHCIEGLRDAAFHLVFSPDGRFLAVLLGSGGLRVFGRETGWEEAARDEDYGDSSNGAAFSADGRLATTCYDGHVRLYDRDFRLAAKKETTEGKEPYGVSFNPAGDRLAVGYDYTTAVSILDGHDLCELARPDTRGIERGNLGRTAWSDDGSVVYAGGRYVASGGCPIVAWSEAGAGKRREIVVCGDTVMGLFGYPGGGLLVAGADPYLAVLDASDSPCWEQPPRKADFRQHSRALGVSADGSLVDFRYGPGESPSTRFDVKELTLGEAPLNDGLTAPPMQAFPEIEDWEGSLSPTFRGTPLSLLPHEISRSLAVHPEDRRFVLGADWRLRAYDSDGTLLWRRPIPGMAAAINVSADGRLVVAMHDDGTIRWYRRDEGRELLAFFPLVDRKNWVAWTPEGFYAATAGAYGLLRWHINHGMHAPAEAISVDEITELRRPGALRLILQEMETARALGLADMERARRAVQTRTGTSFAPGQRLHVLAIGISDYGAQAKHLRLRYADRDADDVASALLNTQSGLYADVSVHLLRNEEVTRGGVFQAFRAVREELAQSEPGQDLAVVLFSGHGRIVDGNLYLFVYGIDDSSGSGIKATALPVNDFRDELHKLGSLGRVLVLIDACHSGAASRDSGDLPMNADMLRTMLATANVTVLTSSNADEPSHEDERWQNGAFTEAFLDALRHADKDRNGLISVTDLASYLAAQVPLLTEKKQKPGVEVRFQSDVFIAAL